MNKKLMEKCIVTNFAKVLDSKGYVFFNKGNYNLNIIGVRGEGLDVTNKFEDAIVVIYMDENGNLNKKVYEVTTRPGLYWMKNLMNKKGTAILVPNQYRGTWQIGYHKGQYEALVQRKPIKVYRDGNFDTKYDLNPETIDEGIFGVNIHKAGANSVQIDKWSAGCQVFAKSSDFYNFMALCHKQVENGYGKSFTYTLLNERDLG